MHKIWLTFIIEQYDIISLHEPKTVFTYWQRSSYKILSSWGITFQLCAHMYVCTMG